MKTETKLFENALNTTSVNGKKLREYINENYISISVLGKIRAEIDDTTEIHSDGEFYIKNIDVKRIIDKYKTESNSEMLVCPACGLDVHSDFKTCPRCGAKMIEPQESFLKKCLEGTAKLSELGDYVERWHDENNGDMSLREFLGLTEAEYSAWGKNGDDIFEEFLSARKERRESKI